MSGQKPEAVEARRKQVLDALHRTVAEDGEVTIRGIARRAGVDHGFIMRRPDLHDAITGRMDRRDVRRPTYTATLSDRERAIVDQAAAGTPMAQYAREALLERAARDLGMDLEDLDVAGRPAPRPAPRRANRGSKTADNAKENSK